MADIVMFGGTSEGRLITERFQQEFAGTDISLCVSVATEYGATLLKEDKNVSIHVGSLDSDDMKKFLRNQGATLCIDATHPYARIATENIYSVCNELGIAYIRVARGEMNYKDDDKEDRDDVILVDSVAEAVDFLAGTEGNIFITTGSKELDKFTRLYDYRNRCVARVLSTLPVAIRCNSLGFEGKNLIAMQGPFSEELNYQMLIMHDIKWLVTKSSGKAGGFIEKCEAAIRAGAKLVIVGRPKEISKNLVGVEEALEIIKNIYG